MTSVVVSTLPAIAMQYFKEKTQSNIIYSKSRVNVDSTDFVVGMFVSVGHEGGLPRFSRTENIFLVDNTVTFLVRDHNSDYIEHLRSYELSPLNLMIQIMLDLNDALPVFAYSIEGKLFITLRRYIALK